MAWGSGTSPLTTPIRNPLAELLHVANRSGNDDSDQEGRVLPWPNSSTWHSVRLPPELLWSTLIKRIFPSGSHGKLHAHPVPSAPLSTKGSRQSTLGYTHGSSFSVNGAQATNSMVTQDTDKVFIQVRPPCGCNTYVLRLVVLNCVEIIRPRGVPCLSLYSPEGRVIDLETNPSRLQLP